MKNQFLEIPDSFWGLFRSKNRQVYIDALLQINEEYQYSNYFLSREICIQTLSDYFAKTRVVMVQDELEDELDVFLEVYNGLARSYNKALGRPVVRQLARLRGWQPWPALDFCPGR